MKSFNDLSIGILAVLFVIVILEMYFVSSDKTRPDPIDMLDLNHDGVVSRAELKYALQNHIPKKRSFPTLEGITKSATSGALRGFIMGCLMNGVEGAITGAVVLGIINPIIMGAEHFF